MGLAPAANHATSHAMPHPENLAEVLPQGLFCETRGFFIDPTRAVDRAVITHAIPTTPTRHRAVAGQPRHPGGMRARMARATPARPSNPWPGRVLRAGEVQIWLQPAGHVLGSAQVQWNGAAAASVSGDYKRRPTHCDPFIPIPATSSSPRHLRPAVSAIRRRRRNPPLRTACLFPERTHVIAAIPWARPAADRPAARAGGRAIWLHGALVSMCKVYETLGVGLGDLRRDGARRKSWLVRSCWPRQCRRRPLGAALAEPVVCMARAGWGAPARQARGVELRW